MNKEKKYYEAYEERYKQVHQQSLQWASSNHSPIVYETIQKYHIISQMNSLEIGCGEGRDALFLLDKDFSLLATDISKEAITYCKNTNPQRAQCFQVLNCIQEQLDMKFDFIYSVAVIHMLVLDADRKSFYQFIHHHLSSSGIALICTMGDGQYEYQSDIHQAFELQERVHEETGKTLFLAGTSCRIVNFQTFEKELKQNDFQILEQGMTAIEPDFPQMMYAVVRKI